MEKVAAPSGKADRKPEVPRPRYALEDVAGWAWDSKDWAFQTKRTFLWNSKVREGVHNRPQEQT